MWATTAPLIIREEDARSHAASALYDAYLAELERRIEGFRRHAYPGAPPDDYAPPGGALLVAYDGEQPIASGGLRRLEPGVGEIKRMYVAPSARGAGHGRRLLAALEAAARDRGYARVLLDTSHGLAEAQALYRSAGYREIARYNDNPYCELWFEKLLAPTARP